MCTRVCVCVCVRACVRVCVVWCVPARTSVLWNRFSERTSMGSRPDPPAGLLVAASPRRTSVETAGGIWGERGALERMSGSGVRVRVRVRVRERGQGLGLGSG